MNESREPKWGPVEGDPTAFRIDLPLVPERLVVICWDANPVASGGTPVKPKKVEFEIRPIVDDRWPPDD